MSTKKEWEDWMTREEKEVAWERINDQRRDDKMQTVSMSDVGKKLATPIVLNYKLTILEKVTIFLLDLLPYSKRKMKIRQWVLWHRRDAEAMK